MRSGRKFLCALLGASLGAAAFAVGPGATPAVANANKPCATVAPPLGATKFLITGDSIVHETRGDYTWRYFLYKQLVAAGVKTDFVGSYNWTLDPNTGAGGHCGYVDSSFDTDHTGFPGSEIAEFNAIDPNNGTLGLPWIRYEVATHDADVVVSLIGANDLARTGATATGVVNLAKTYIANIRAANPDATIILSRAPVGGRYGSKPNAAYNEALAEAIPAISTSQSPVVLADVLSDWGSATNTWDEIHPNVVGEQKVAKGLADALSSVGIGAPGVAVNPAFKVGPRDPVSNFVATRNGAKANVSFTLAPGTMGIQVVAQDVTAGTGPWVEVGACPTRFACSTLSTVSLQPGHTYKIDAHPRKTWALATDVWSTAPGGAPGLTAITIPASPAPVAQAPVAGAHSAQVSWSAVPGATGYQVEVLSPSGTRSAPVPVTTTSRTFTGLAPARRYGFRVRTVVDGVLSDWSNQVFTVAKANVLAKPGKPKVVKASGSKVKVTWRKSAGADRWVVQYRKGSGAWKSSKTLTTRSFKTPKLTKKKTYSFRVVPYDGPVAGKPSSVSKIKVK